jgi:hypothetical protein
VHRDRLVLLVVPLEILVHRDQLENLEDRLVQLEILEVLVILVLLD